MSARAEPEAREAQSARPRAIDARRHVTSRKRQAGQGAEEPVIRSLSTPRTALELQTAAHAAEMFAVCRTRAYTSARSRALLVRLGFEPVDLPGIEADEESMERKA